MPTVMTGRDGVVVRRARDLARQFFQRLALRLGDEEGGEAADQHEEGEDLHDVVEPWGFIARDTAAGSERAEDALRDDSADFAGSGGEAVRSGAVPSWEAFAGDDERRGVRTCGNNGSIKLSGGQV